MGHLILRHCKSSNVEEVASMDTPRLVSDHAVRVLVMMLEIVVDPSKRYTIPG